MDTLDTFTQTYIVVCLIGSTLGALTLLNILFELLWPDATSSDAHAYRSDAE